MNEPIEGSVFTRLDPSEASNKADSGEAIVVDVREDEERAAGRIPGSEHVPLGELGERIEDLPEDKEVVLVCRSGSRSSMAAAALAEAGYRVSNLEGGVKAWVTEGLPFEGSVA